MRLLFVRDSKPLQHLQVRFPGIQGLSGEARTDAEGFIEVNLPEGLVHCEICDSNGRWRKRSIDTGTSRDSLLVVETAVPQAMVFGRSNATRKSRPTNIHLSGPSSPAQRRDDAHGRITAPTLLRNHTRDLGDRYHFETILGRGGMGVVLRARDTLLSRPVAIKMLNEEYRENEEAQQLFLGEARSISTLSHQNLAAVHDIATIEGRTLMVQEYIEGENLEKVLQRHGALSEVAVLRIGIQLARVLGYLHGRGIIHRDLKPGNMLLEPDGTLKIVDFGLSRSLGQIHSKGTRVRGTPAYMAPEQVLGQELTFTTDIYQLGVTLYELLSGDLPYPQGDQAYAHVHLEPPRLEEKLPELTPEMAALVHDCLEKDARARPDSQQVGERMRVIYLEGGPQFQDENGPVRVSESLLFSTSDLRQSTPDAHRVTSDPSLRTPQQQQQERIVSTPAPTPAPAQATEPEEVAAREPGSPDRRNRRPLIPILLAAAAVLLTTGGVIAYIGGGGGEPGAPAVQVASAPVTDPPPPAEEVVAEEPPVPDAPFEDEAMAAAAAAAMSAEENAAALAVATGDEEIEATDDEPDAEAVSPAPVARKSPPREKAQRATRPAPSTKKVAEKAEAPGKPAPAEADEADEPEAPAEVAAEATKGEVAPRGEAAAAKAPAAKAPAAAPREEDDEADEPATRTIRKRVIRKRVIRKRIIRRKKEAPKVFRSF